MKSLRFTRLVRLSLAEMRHLVSFPVARVFCFAMNSLIAMKMVDTGVIAPRHRVMAMGGDTLVVGMRTGHGVLVQKPVGQGAVPDVGSGWMSIPEIELPGATRIGAGRMMEDQVEGMVLVVIRVILGNYLEGTVHGVMEGILGRLAAVR